MHLKKGTLLKHGDYRIESVLGQGGFGITYLAYQIGLDRKVAIKEFFMSDFCERDPETSHVSLGTSGSRETVEKFKAKFIKEAQTIARLNNPHIIRIHDVFEENDTAYYVMEYIDGQSLKDVLPSGMALTEAVALNYIRQVSEALSEVHASGLLHLDVKPGNIMVDFKGRAVLIDFGVSKRFDNGGSSENLTTTTTLPYTPGYAPLEQMDPNGSELTPASDIYALGATLYRFLSGESPSAATTRARRKNMESLPESVSPSVRNAVNRAMQIDEEDRPQSVADFLALLEVPVSAVSEDAVIVHDVDESTVHEDDTKTNGETGNSVNTPKIADSKPVVDEQENKKGKSWMLWALIALIGIGVGLSALFMGGGYVVVSDSDSVQVNKVDEDSLRLVADEQQAESLRIAEERRQAEEEELARQEEQRRAEEEERKRQAEQRRAEEEERKRQEEEHQAEERRLAEEAELARQEEQRRAEEEERKRQAEQRQEEERRQAEEAERKRQEEEARRQAASVSTDSRGNKTFTVNGVSFKMVAVNGGTFRMGATKDMDPDARDNEHPVHDVTLSDYYIGETEVTQELWQAVMGSNPSHFTGNLQRPVELVSWNDCRTFIGKLNSLTGGNFRLPTEAEWEYAARGGNKSQGYKYSGSDNIDEVAWYTSNSSKTTYAVKTKSPNELGIYDMSGNVEEWCQDCYGDYSRAAQTNPKGPSSGSYRVYRGSSWGSDAADCRCTYRSLNWGSSKGSGLGLRLVSQ